MATIIYIVDPSSERRHAWAETLANDGFEIRTVESADAFLELVVPDAQGCVIGPSDLPGMGMRALIEIIRARKLHLPVVVVGHDGDLVTAVDLIRAGAAEYLEPPVSGRRLRSVIREELRRA